MEVDPLKFAQAQRFKPSVPPIINGCLSYARLRQGPSYVDLTLPLG